MVNTSQDLLKAFVKLFYLLVKLYQIFLFCWTGSELTYNVSSINHVAELLCNMLLILFQSRTNWRKKFISPTFNDSTRRRQRQWSCSCKGWSTREKNGDHSRIYYRFRTTRNIIWTAGGLFEIELSLDTFVAVGIIIKTWFDFLLIPHIFPDH